MKKLDRFILESSISDGPAGTVYQAQEVLPGDNHRTVALKVLPAIAKGDDVALERFHNEVKILAQLAVQPHIATIYSMGITEGYPWLAMEYAETTAAQHIFDEPANPKAVERLLEQVADGLAAMHALEPPLVHQDLKPANILIDPSGNYKITDFSMASAVAANRTQGLATVRYAAPELLTSELGKVGPATDLYALGHIAYEMALGNRLHRQQFPAVFEGNAGAGGGTREPPPNKWMMWHASGNTKPPALIELRRDFPTALSEIIARLMAKPLTQRYGSAKELLADLAGLQSVPVVPMAPAASAPPPSAPSAIALAPPEPVPTIAPTTEQAAEDAAPTPPSAPRKSAPPPSSARYWVRLRGRVTGPYDLPTLQRQIRQGALSRLHQLSTDKLTWKPASEIEDLYGPTIV